MPFFWPITLVLIIVGTISGCISLALQVIEGKTVVGSTANNVVYYTKHFTAIIAVFMSILGISIIVL